LLNPVKLTIRDLKGLFIDSSKEARETGLRFLRGGCGAGYIGVCPKRHALGRLAGGDGRRHGVGAVAALWGGLEVGWRGVGQISPKSIISLKTQVVPIFEWPILSLAFLLHPHPPLTYLGENKRVALRLQSDSPMTCYMILYRFELEPFPAYTIGI